MDEERIKVLYVDDEPGNLNVFKAGFRFNFDVYTANSAKEGLALLNTTLIHVIIADQRMPEMTGVEFFESLLESHPDPIRILLTGYADIEAVIQAINRGRVYRYLRKPWDNDELKQSIENAYDVYKARKELKEKNEQLSKLNGELNRFVYSASHDLKAPIVSVMGLLKVAEIEGYKKDTEKYFTMISASIKQLDTFIHNIINYYKNHKLDRIYNEIDFAKHVQEVLDSYTYLNTNNVQITNRVVQTSKFVSDEFRVRVVLNNLISNAIKYQRKDEPAKKVYIDVVVDEHEAKIKIVDNGIGIKKAYINNIYNMFYRATRESTGSGIGLYIVKEAVDKVGGTIEVISQENEGTTFNIKIPNMIFQENYTKDLEEV